MKSKSDRDLDGFLARTPTTPEDVIALERARSLDCLDPVEYLSFLKAFASSHPPTREIPPRHEPFKL